MYHTGLHSGDCGTARLLYGEESLGVIFLRPFAYLFWYSFALVNERLAWESTLALLPTDGQLEPAFIRQGNPTSSEQKAQPGALRTGRRCPEW